jgi:hypothetical protein
MRVVQTTARIADRAGGGLAKMIWVDAKYANVFPVSGQLR